ncbi:unnamed protein product [Prorocentrum cordatum]|uniref:Uncharacterized protein n=1 Tax=Prorocentrum cordatum TaxID=2364126 RepID=A0ABN9RWU1_9DINO|nr:unnamed protein product [Polarella glacialis]
MAEGGSAWQRQALRLRRLSGPVDGEEPEAARLAALLADLCEASRSRAECLSTPAARSIYTARVLEPGVRDAMGAVRARWNAVGDLLAEARDASLLIETMEEMCRFFDRFPLGEHMVSVVDEVNTMRLGMIEKTSDALADAVRKVLRRLDTESAVFSYALGPALAILSCRLRPSNFQLVATQGVGKIAETLMGELLRQAPFADDDRMGLFSSNCGGDLPAVLSVVSDPSCLRPLATLLEGCTLLGLDKARAAELISVLRQVKRCSSSRPAVLDLAEAAPSSDVLRQRQAEAYDAAGVADISVGDALSVLLKRPDLMGTMTVDDLEDAPFSTLQDLLPAGAMLGGLGGGALQPLQLGAGTAHATLQRGAGAAQATFQLGARGLAGGAGLLKGTLQRGLAGAAAAAR